MGNSNYSINNQIAKPVLKWAGGKTQLLPQIYPRLPKKFDRYIEPFIGGGAVYFALGPEDAFISDSNPELINLYSSIAKEPDLVIDELKKLRNTKDDFYHIRSLDWKFLSSAEAAARTIYLNKTCFNGLFRVNKKGQFNVPYGATDRTVIIHEDVIRAASKVLRTAQICCMDYHEVLMQIAKAGDFVFLDPPYIPVSEFADFKRYTKEQFSMSDHEQLANDVLELTNRGCYVMLTNSNHPVVHDLYKGFRIEVFQTKRMISKNSNTRTGEDIIVTNYEF